MKATYQIKITNGDIENFNIRFPDKDFSMKVSIRVDDTFYPWTKTLKVEPNLMHYRLGFNIGNLQGRIIERHGYEFWNGLNATLEIEIEEL